MIHMEIAHVFAFHRNLQHQRYSEGQASRFYWIKVSRLLFLDVSLCVSEPLACKFQISNVRDAFLSICMLSVPVFAISLFEWLLVLLYEAACMV
jgi:hypothetical protein